jgi:hypothetical protein
VPSAGGCAVTTVASSRMQVTPSTALSATRTGGSTGTCAQACRRAARRGGQRAPRDLPAVRDLPQHPPRRRHRRHRAIPLRLIPHNPQVADHPRPVRDRARQVSDHPPPGHARRVGPAPATTFRSGPSGPPATAAAPAPHATRHPHRPGNGKTLRPSRSVHLTSAPRTGMTRTSATLIVPAQEHFSMQARDQPPSPLKGRASIVTDWRRCMSASLLQRRWPTMLTGSSRTSSRCC